MKAEKGITDKIVDRIQGDFAVKFKLGLSVISLQIDLNSKELGETGLIQKQPGQRTKKFILEKYSDTQFNYQNE